MKTILEICLFIKIENVVLIVKTYVLWEMVVLIPD